MNPIKKKRTRKRQSALIPDDNQEEEKKEDSRVETALQELQLQDECGRGGG